MESRQSDPTTVDDSRVPRQSPAGAPAHRAPAPAGPTGDSPALPSTRRRDLLLGLGLGLLGFVTIWMVRDVPLFHRAPLILPVAFTMVALALAGFWASLLAFAPGILGSILYLLPARAHFHVADPLDRLRVLFTSVLVLALGGLMAWQRVGRRRLVAREREVRESEERYRTLLEQASDAILVTDSTHRLVIVNQRACELLGYTAQELIGRDIRQMISPESLRLRPFQYLELREKPLILAEREMIRKDGSRVFVEVTARLMTDGRTQAIVRDVTERRRSEETMRQLESQLQHLQRLEAVGRLAGGVAHDFNNLLVVMLGSARMLIDSDPRGPAAERGREIVDAGERAASLTRQLLAFSRKQTMRFEVVDPNRIASEFEMMLRRVAGADHRLVLELDPGIGRVRADAVQLEQVLLNLVLNARHALPHGGAIELRTHSERLDPGGDGGGPRRYVVLSVKDDGVGMDAETQERMFEPFFTTRPAGQGTGLGLSTVYGIVRQSGGFIRVDSAVGRGTTVNVCLPALGEEAVVERSDASPAESMTGSGSLVLLVEDEASVRRIVRQMLEGHGLGVIEAASGEEALDLAPRLATAPALLVTDLTMPGMDGRQLANALALRWPELRVLYLSGFVYEGLEMPGLAAAGRGFLAKPFTADQLLQSLQKLVGVATPAAGGG